MLMKTNTRNDHRNIDGSNNNIDNPDWGKAETPLLRKTEVAYADKISTLAERGNINPNPREVSNKLCHQTQTNPSKNGLTDFIWAWGQFLDHTIDLTETRDDESADFQTPGDDPVLPNAKISFNRSQFDIDSGSGTDNPRQQLNQISTYIDASNVYGSDQQRADALRVYDGTGRLKTSTSDKGELLPYNVTQLPNAPSTDQSFFVAGDIRSNEHAVLTCMHTLFVREHNRLCQEIVTSNPELYGCDEDIYQEARHIVGGLIQSITYNEFLPTLLGPDALKPYSGYDENVNASISNIFSTACYRLGHSMLSSTINLGTNGRTLKLRDAFFSPALVRHYGIEIFFSGLANQVMQEIDTKVSEDVRSFLFGNPVPAPDASLLDLPALNIQRGRDHGLADYNQCREDFDLKKQNNFDDITDDKDLRKALKDVYGKVENIDPWIGALAEDHVEGSNVGELLLMVLKDQFERLRDGDRYWFQNDENIADDRKVEINNTRLSDVIRRNTDIDEISDNIFVLSN